MGTKDVMAREYLSNPERFADVFNAVVYGGEQVVQSRSLRQLDSAHHLVSPGMRGVVSLQRHRDVLRAWQAMSDGNTTYALLAIEEQSHDHLAIPVRCMLYDAMAYAGQIRDIGTSHKEEPGGSSAEFLSGLVKTDRIAPVVTLVVHLSSSPWEGPTSLKEMPSDCDERLLELVPDWHANLVSPPALSREDLSRFRTDVGLVLGYIKYDKDQEALTRYVNDDVRFHEFDAQSARLVNEFTNSMLVLKDEERKVDMCKALDDMRKESYDNGYRAGRQAAEKSAKTAAVAVLSGLVRDGLLSVENAAERVGVSVDEFQARARALV